jgi:hypothetical protein
MAGYGDGPNCAVFRRGVRLLVENSPQWGRRGDFYHPVLSPLITPARLRDFWVAGVWCAIHIIHLGLAPDPVSPWWLFAIVYGQDGLPSDLTGIQALDPNSANILEPWFKFTESDTLDTRNKGLIRQLLVTYLDLSDVRFVSHASNYPSDPFQIDSLPCFNNHAQLNYMPWSRSLWYYPCYWVIITHGAMLNFWHFWMVST